MAKSPSHKFGQIIGNLLEEIISSILTDFCEQRGLYLDKKGHRGKARRGSKVTWKDKYGNEHDLDFVIERDGSPDKTGQPIAIIEAAWRRYTKHSRNKVQEIQGAVLPVAECHNLEAPFLGVVLAGIFTDNSINQLESFGFKVLYIPYKTITDAFCCANIDVRFDEFTPDDEFKQCVKKIEELAVSEREGLKQMLISLNKEQIDHFFNLLAETIDRMINKILIIPLYGHDRCFQDIQAAVDFIESYHESPPEGGLRRYEVIVEYSNYDRIEAEFSNKDRIIKFLKSLLS
ncbi:MAG: DNA methylase [bacterium]